MGDNSYAARKHPSSSARLNEIDIMASNKYPGSSPNIADFSTLQKHNNMLQVVQYPYTQEPVVVEQQSESNNSAELLLPARLAVPVGVAQVVIGGSMVVCGSFALRYQSYLFYYGSGLWGGTLAGLAGILAVTATKSEFGRSLWDCGGKRWRTRVYLSVVITALIAAILTAVFSTSGLFRDTQYDYSQEVKAELTLYEKMQEKKKSSAIVIAAILLLLSVLQILLCFCSLGIALRVLCIKSYGKHGWLIQDSSDGSDVTKKEITGQEHQARKDRLLCWLGHQKKQYFSSQHKAAAGAAAAAAAAAQKNNRMLQSRSHHGQRLTPTTLVPVRHPQLQFQRPYATLPLVFPSPFPVPSPRSILGPYNLPPLFPFPTASPMMVPVVHQLPVRRARSLGRVSVANSRCSGEQRRLSNNMRYPAPERISSEDLGAKEKAAEITEEQVEKTYTGLDREIAETFINNTMSSN